MTATTYKWQILAKALFIYGCLASLVGLYMHVENNYANPAELARWFEWQGDLATWLTGIHAMTFLVTFARVPAPEKDPKFAPIVRPSGKAVAIGRVVLLAAAANVFVSIAIGVIRGQDHGLASAVFLLSATYTALHWALRPENIFSWRVLRILREGLYPYLLDWWMTPLAHKSRARRRVIPLDRWLDELVRACESAVDSRLMTSSGVGEIESLEFQHLLLDELESRACLTHYQERLSADGFREIRRFVRAVESLGHRSPDPLAWQSVANSANLVLAVRENLLARRGPSETGS